MTSFYLIHHRMMFVELRPTALALVSASCASQLLRGAV